MSEGQNKSVLIITKKDLLVDVISVFLEGLFPSDIEVADNSRKLEAYFQAQPPRTLDLLIVEDERLLTAAGKQLGDFLAPTIVVGKAPEPLPKTGRRLVYLPSPMNLDSLASAFGELAQGAGFPVREFCPVRLEVLVLFGRALDQDIYRQNLDDSYEVLFPKGERLDLSEDTFAGLARKKYFFLRSEDFVAFMKDFASAIQSSAASSENVFELGDSVQTTASVHELIANAIPELGFTPELQQATKASIDMAVTAIKKDPRLSDLIAALTQMDSDYRSWHSVALCYMSCRLSSLMTWDSANTHYKLSLASFLHDIKLTQPGLERVRTIEDLDRKKPSKADRAAFLEHPHAAAALARQMKDFPGDVDHIIAQHHELPGGNGFPLGLNHTKISPLASLFIIAHDLTEELFDKQAAFSLKDSVARLERTYTQGYFKRVIASLKDLVTKEAAGM